MNRPIKFRGLEYNYLANGIGNEPRKTWRYGSLRTSYGFMLRDTDSVNCWIYTQDGTQWDDEVWVVEPSTVGQFTGLLDKYGKEIYEGDVVKYYQPYSNTWHTHIVKWDKRWSCFGLFQNDSEWCKESDWVKIIEIEVIGNIHDNPELIEK